MIRRLVATLAFLLAATHSALAQERIPFNSLKVGDRELTFNVTMSLTRAVALLGTADTNNRGDASTSLTWLCYRAAVASDTAILIVESSEMGGTSVTSFTLLRPGGDPGLERRCAPLAVAPRTIATDRGITLGMTKVQVEQVLGRATRDSAGIVKYEWLRQRRGRFGRAENVDYSEGSFLDIWFAHGIVIRLSGDRMDIS
jgi:hypothetical protein